MGGPVGPYMQSQRMGMFKQYAEQLVQGAGKAYYCFCTEERLNGMRGPARCRRNDPLRLPPRLYPPRKLPAKLTRASLCHPPEKIPERRGGL